MNIVKKSKQADPEDSLEASLAPPTEVPTDGSDERGDFVPGLLELKSILVPIDFSEISRSALEYAVPFAKRFGA
ncbi:MAG TPA: universal stress protein, partial [Chthoniobacterales bacterium]